MLLFNFLNNALLGSKHAIPVLNPKTQGAKSVGGWFISSVRLTISGGKNSVGYWLGVGAGCERR